MAETCKGCSAVHKELWPKGKAAYRCMDPEAGQRRGHVIETAKAEYEASLIRPAWCPRKERRNE